MQFLLLLDACTKHVPYLACDYVLSDHYRKNYSISYSRINLIRLIYCCRRLSRGYEILRRCAQPRVTILSSNHSCCAVGENLPSSKGWFVELSVCNNCHLMKAVVVVLTGIRRTKRFE